MNTASAQFLLFSLVGACAYNLFRAVAWRQFVLFAMSCYFLSTFSHSPAAFVPMAAFLAVGYIGVLLMQRGYKKLFVPTLLFEILLLIWLKKYTFLPHATFLQFAYVTLGLSYMCFRTLHLLIEAKESDLPRIDPVSYVNYTVNFLTLVSGPIQLYRDFAETQMAPVRPPLSLADIGSAVQRIAVGFFKVAILGLAFSSLQTYGMTQLPLAETNAQRVLAGILIAGAYPIYLYMNFSGYMDIVIGIGRFFRFTLPENFDRPFAAPNFMIFWNRWHMTLSNFFKNYFFNPLLLSLMRRFTSKSVEPFLAVLAFFLTFFVLGIWHGQTSVFAVYGVVLGLGVSLNKLYQLLMIRRMGQKAYKQLSRNELYMSICRGVTFTYFTFSLFFFWSNWHQMGQFLRSLNAASLAEIWLGIFLLATVILALIEFVSSRATSLTWNGVPALQSRYIRTAYTTALVVITLAILSLMNAPAPENVYKAF